jgi:menaquinone-dependent protoporphyrinogen IX oxidase
MPRTFWIIARQGPNQEGTSSIQRHLQENEWNIQIILVFCGGYKIKIYFNIFLGGNY